MTTPTYHTRQDEPLQPDDNAPPSMLSPLQSPDDYRWHYHCQPMFAEIRRDQAEIKHALFIGEDGRSIVAQIHGHSRVIRLLLSIHLLVVSAALALVSKTLYDVIRYHRTAPAAVLTTAAGEANITNLNSRLDIPAPSPVPSTPSATSDAQTPEPSGGGQWHNANSQNLSTASKQDESISFANVNMPTLSRPAIIPTSPAIYAPAKKPNP